MFTEWKRKEKESWKTFLSRPENFLRELNKPYSYGDLWAFVYRKNFETILKIVNIRKGQRVLEIGCGSGWLSEWFAEEGATPTGVDVSPEFCKISRLRARQRSFDADFICADGEHLPFKDNTFNITVAYQSLHHFLHPEKAAGEALRVSQTLVLGDEPATLPLPGLTLKLLKMIAFARAHTGEVSGVGGARFDPLELESTYRRKGYIVKFEREWSFVPTIFSKLEKMKIVRDIYRTAYSLLMSKKTLRNLGHGLIMVIQTPKPSSSVRGCVSNA